ncbi:MAG: hypothetical protein WDW38_011131 [Sanguina aurantia]
MFEARIEQGNLLKKLVDGIKDLVTDVNFDLSSNGLGMQAMDTSHVSLVSFLLEADGFKEFRCDRARSLGVSVASLQKVLKCAGADDIITLKADDDGDVMSLMFESPDGDRISDFELKLLDIDSEHLGIPESDFAAQVSLSSAEFKRLTTDLMSIGPNVNISVTKDGVKFSTTGDIGTANVTLRHGHNERSEAKETKNKKEAISTSIEMVTPVSLNFSAKYIVSFAKASALSDKVTLTLTKDLPLMVQFRMEDVGYLRFYLAPKIDDDDVAEEGGAGNDEE